jgi:8-oxo-dGTP pyrophosphatase MutT (NUDIX family)
VSEQIRVTVASVIEHEGRFLVVEEETDNGIRFNQPAGHLEPYESIVAAAARETLEETAYHFVPAALVGIYRYRYPHSGIVYVRFTFTGKLGAHEAGRPLDREILRALWLTPAELQALRERHRSPLVMRSVEDYLAGRRYPLDLLLQYDG